MIYDDLISGYWICFDNYIIVQCCSLRMRCPAVRQSMRWNWPGVKSDGIGTPWFRPKLPSVGAVPRCRNQGENMGNTWRMLSQLAELFFLWYHLWSDKHHRFHSDFSHFFMIWNSSSAVALTPRCAGCGRKADGWVWALEAVGPGRQTQKKHAVDAQPHVRSTCQVWSTKVGPSEISRFQYVS